MPQLLNAAVRRIFTSWAKTGKAPGLLYSQIEKRAKTFGHEKRLRRLADGLVMECDLRDHIQQQIYFFGAYEPVEINLLLSLIQPGSTIVDAGANIGFYSLMMAQKAGPSGEVHAFEPIPETFALLTRHVSLNKNIGKIHANRLALWNKTETLQFNLGEQHEHNCGGYSAASGEKGGRMVSCNAVTLSEYFRAAGLARLDVLKMDIEGAELSALEGALELIGRFRPIICLEVCRSTCQAFGYDPERLWEKLSQ
ncbi:MAG: FkbM family methyltransferase, partial [Bdellovibrionota bacterium]